MSDLIDALAVLGVLLLGICTLALPFIMMGVGLNQVDKKFEESRYICPRCGASNSLVRKVEGVECCPRCGKKIKEVGKNE